MAWLDAITQTPSLLYGATGALGLIVGSFLNVVIYRLPRMMEEDWRRACAETLGHEQGAPAAPSLTLARPGSHCPSCGHPVRPLENIPLLSYLVLGGHCSACREPIGLRYPIVEAMTGLLSVAVVWQLGPGWTAAGGLVLTWGLIALAVIDLDTQILPDAITLPLLWLGLLLSLGGWITDARSAILGAAAGYLALWGVFQLFRLLTGKEGMGYGDFKLLAVLGAWLGWQHLPQIVVLSALVGALVGGFLILVRGHDRQEPIPFGPYLAAAGWIGLLWGDAINRAYLQWAGLA
jgi:leader peptidase (prepilin peptidase)/N-methyltransferase